MHVPELNPAGHTRLSPEAYLTALRRQAARARAAKTVGEGRGAVTDEETAAQLRAQAEDLDGVDET